MREQSGIERHSCERQVGGARGRTPDAACEVPLHRQTLDPNYARALALVGRYGPNDWLPVLLQGETGTGKSWFARELHALSPRAKGAFVAVNLAAVDTALASSSLFGHLAGAFTGAIRQQRGAFEQAHGGTLFLDELSGASSALQGMLLHAVERGQITPLGAERTLVVDCRLVAAINRPAPELVRSGHVLPDLWHRLGGLTISLPALRDRRSDILPLVKSMAARDALRCTDRPTPPHFASDALRRLESAYWPGNVRQLESVVRRLMLSVDPGTTIDTCVLDEFVPREELEQSPSENAQLVRHSRGGHKVTTREVVDMVERSRSPAEAARRLGVDRATIGRHLASARRADASGAKS